MALHNFRQVFLPYGFSRKEGRYGIRWEAFNREYSPLGCTVPHTRVSLAVEQELTNESDRRALLRANTRLEKYIEQIAHTTNGAKNEFWQIGRAHV